MQHLFNAVLRRCQFHTRWQPCKYKACITYALPKSTVEIGDHVSIGHNVTFTARLYTTMLDGMGATVLGGAVVGEGAIVAANALVLSNQ